jgi:hypothetical protein
MGVVAGLNERSDSMSEPATHRVKLDLSSLDELFVETEFNPLRGKVEEVSGLERLANQLRPLPRAPVCARIRLPASERTPDLEERCRAALNAVAERRLERNRNDARSLRMEGYATLWRGLVFLALCLLGSRLMGEIDLLPGFVERFIDEGLVIAGWVALWYPLDVLLYQRWPLARERRLYESLRDMQLEFEFRG